MKHLVIVIMIFAVMLPISAQESSQSILIGDFDKTLQGFSLNRGELVKVNLEEEFLLPIEIDFIFDMPNGLGMNNEDLAPGFAGTAGIIDLGLVPLTDNFDFSEEEFNIFLVPDAIIEGHTYLIKTADAEHYGKIHILNFDSLNETLEFSWVYLEE